MRLPIVDADGHIMEPFEMWQERLPPEYRDRAWNLNRDAEGREQVRFQGRFIQSGYSIGTMCTPGGMSAGGRLDVEMEDVHPGAWDPAIRIDTMDRQGIAVSVLFPTMTLGLDDIDDLGFAHAYAQAYNSWIADYARHDPMRLRWAAVIPLVDMEWALGELERCVADGCTTVMLSPIPTPDLRTLGSSDRDPFWARLQELDMPAVVHAADPGSKTLGMRQLWMNHGQWYAAVPFQLTLGVMYVIDGGVLNRFPDLEIGFFEGDVGWLPHWLGRLENTYRKVALLSQVPETRGPIEQFRAQCTISGEPSDLGLALAADLVGADRVLWASDWPHQDGAWPDPIAVLRDRTDLTDEQKRQMLVDGPARFFRIDLAPVLARLGAGWSLDAPVAGIPGLVPGDPDGVYYAGDFEEVGTR